MPIPIVECTASSLPETALELGEEGEGLDGREVVGIDLAQVVEDPLVGGAEEAELAAGGGLRRRLAGVGEPRPALPIELGPLQGGEDLLGAHDHGGGQAGQASDLDAQRAVR